MLAGRRISSNNLSKVVIGLTAGSSLLAMSTPGWGQATGAATAAREVPASNPPSQGLEEIVVTAQRRSERLQDVPVAVTAFSSEQLERQNITDVHSLAGLSPSLYIEKQNLDSSGTSISMRGLSSLTQTILQDPGIGFYVNGAYLPRTVGTNVAFIDVADVEVLRGPQGTLFGRNTIGGALTIATQQPTDRFEGYVEAGFGNYNEKNFTGVLNVPLVSDRLDARLVAAHLEHSGYQHDRFLNIDQSPDDSTYFRLSLKGQISDDWSLLVVGDWLRDNIGSQGDKIINLTPGSRTATYPGKLDPPSPYGSLFNYIGGDLYTNDANFYPQNVVKVSGVSAALTGDLGFATFKDIIAYRHVNVGRAQDTDGTPYDIIKNDLNPVKSDSYSEEAQLLGKSFDNRLEWIGGLYYFHEMGLDGLQTTVMPLDHPLPTVQPSHLIANNFNSGRNISYAAFGQMTYAILPNLRLTGGVRYTYDERYAQEDSSATDVIHKIVLCTLPVGIRITPTQCVSPQLGARYHYFPWTVKLAYKPTNEINIYASHAESFRSGGFPQAGGTNVRSYIPFGPEHTSTEEIGAKIDWWSHHLRTDLALYHTQYDDIQLNTFALTSTGAPYNVVGNFGKGRIDGIEFEQGALLGDLRLNGTYGFLNARFVEGPYRGRPYLIVPNQTASLSADYPVEVSFGTVTFHADYEWKTRVQYQYNSPQASRGAALDGQQPYEIVNLMASLDLGSIPLTIRFWVKNLTDKRYVVWVSDQSASLGGEYAVPGDPKTFGVTFRYRFHLGS
jgi:iron complex outermembrane receptor protein